MGIDLNEFYRQGLNVVFFVKPTIAGTGAKYEAEGVFVLAQKGGRITPIAKANSAALARRIAKAMRDAEGRAK